MHLKLIGSIAIAAVNSIIPVALGNTPMCFLDRSHLGEGWFVLVEDTSKIKAIQSRLPPRAYAHICTTIWWNDAKPRTTVIEIGKFDRQKDASNFGQRIRKELKTKVQVNSGPPTGE